MFAFNESNSIHSCVFNDLIFSNDNLEIPHPRFKERLFVLQPLSEISPNFIDPITKKTIKFLLDEVWWLVTP